MDVSYNRVDYPRQETPDSAHLGFNYTRVTAVGLNGVQPAESSYHRESKLINATTVIKKWGHLFFKLYFPD